MGRRENVMVRAKALPSLPSDQPRVAQAQVNSVSQGSTGMNYRQFCKV